VRRPQGGAQRGALGNLDAFDPAVRHVGGGHSQ
jgi:hypothetical protein